jgi:DNA primase catalytic subunit
MGWAGPTPTTKVGGWHLLPRAILKQNFAAKSREFFIYFFHDFTKIYVRFKKFKTSFELPLQTVARSVEG